MQATYDAADLLWFAVETIAPPRAARHGASRLSVLSGVALVAMFATAAAAQHVTVRVAGARPDSLAAAGFEHYEVSNFAKANHRCRHNEAYWLGAPYFAAGPGAARYVKGRRELNHRSTTTYIRRVLGGESPVADAEQLGPEDAARERLVFGVTDFSAHRFAESERSDPAAALSGAPGDAGVRILLAHQPRSAPAAERMREPLGQSGARRAGMRFRF